VGELFSRGDLPEGVDEDAHAPGARLAVGPAGVVDIAADVLPSRAVDDPPRVHLEKIAAALAVRLFTREQRAGVLHDQRAPRDRLPGEQAEPARCSFHGKIVVVAVRLVASHFHGQGAYTGHSAWSNPAASREVTPF